MNERDFNCWARGGDRVNDREVNKQGESRMRKHRKSINSGLFPLLVSLHYFSYLSGSKILQSLLK